MQFQEDFKTYMLLDGCLRKEGSHPNYLSCFIFCWKCVASCVKSCNFCMENFAKKNMLQKSCKLQTYFDPSPS